MHKIIRLSCDIAVIGGGPGGISAAVCAAKNGADVILVERNCYLGGVASSGLPFLGFLDRTGKPVIGGFAKQFVNQLQIGEEISGHLNSPIFNSYTPFSPETLKIVAANMCQEVGVRILFGCEVFKVKVENECVVQVSAYGKCCEIDIDASIFIDATGDGDVAYLAGAEFFTSKNETGFNQSSTFIFSVTNINYSKIEEYLEKNPEDNNWSNTSMKSSNNCSQQIQEQSIIGFSRLIQEARKAGEFNIPVNELLIGRHLVYPCRFLINSVRVPNDDHTDPLLFSKGILEGYKQIEIWMNFIKKYLPGCENAKLCTIAPVFGVRESRHFIGRKQLKREEMFSYQADERTIALCGYNVDIVNNEDPTKAEFKLLSKAFGIPYDCLVPIRIKRLFLAGRTLSVDNVVFGAVRAMGTIMAIGEAIGIAASICVKENINPSEVEVGKLRKILLEGGAILDN